METQYSSSQVDRYQRIFCFNHCDTVDAKEIASGMMLLWYDDIIVDVVRNVFLQYEAPQFKNVEASSHP